MNQNNFFLTDFTITTSAGSEINFVSDVISLEIYESIFQPFLYGKVIIIDRGHIFYYNPIIGKENVYFNFRFYNQNNQEQEFEFKDFEIFKVNKLLNDKEDNSGNYIYEIHFMQSIGITSFNEHSISYSEKIISDIVSDISSDIIGKDIDNIETTKTQYTIAFPYMYPHEMIKYISNMYAINNNDKYGFLYYTDISLETNYKCINTLMNENKSYTLMSYSKMGQNENPLSFSDKSFDKVLNLKSKFKNGTFGYTEFYFDDTNKEIVTTENTYEDYINNNTLLGNNGLYNKDFDGEHNIYLLENDVNYYTQNKILFENLMYNNINIVTKGIFSKKVGMTCEIDIENISLDEDELDQNMSGKWLALSCTHKFNNNGYFQHTTYSKNAFYNQGSKVADNLY